MTPQDGWGQHIYNQMGIPLYDIPLIIVSAVIVYLAALLIVRLFGARLFTSTTFTSTVGLIMFGALAGRAILGPTPTVAAGIIALLTLITMESIFHGMENIQQNRYLLGGRPVLVFLDGKALKGACKRTHTSQVDLNSAMRSAGIANPNEVRCIILEPHGRYSVIRTGTALSPELYQYVDGADKLFNTNQ